MYNTIIIIPVLGNSKRLPNKNIKLLGGIPLLVHSINYARRSGVQKIVVTTDNEKIKQITLKNNVDRPTELSGDTNTTISVLKHVLEFIDEIFENVILL